jgi:hypothetical protein
MTATRDSRIPDLVCDRDRNRSLDFVLALDRVFDRVRVSDRARARVRARDLDRALYRDLGLDRGLLRTRALDLDVVLTRDLVLAGDLTRALGDAGDLTRALILTGDLIYYLERISAVRAGGRGAEVRVARAAGRLATAAARMLPGRDRARYAEEFRSELWEIARASGGRRTQLAYAARQVLAARRLRAGLRVPRRRGAVP